MNKDYLLVDGYNIIFAWKKLNKLAEDNIEAAKDALINMLCNYQGVRKMNLILVFDAYKVAGGQGSVEKQMIITGRGAVRMSARDLYEEVNATKKHITTYIAQNKPVKNNMLMDNLDKASAQWLEDLRRGKNK